MNIDFPGVCSASTRAVHVSVGLGSSTDSWLFPLLSLCWDSPGQGCREGGKSRKCRWPFAPAAAAGQDGRVPADQEAVAAPPGAVHAHAAAQALRQPPLPAGWLQREEPQHGGCAIPAGMGVPGVLFPATHPAHPSRPCMANTCPSARCFSSWHRESPQLCWLSDGPRQHL